MNLNRVPAIFQLALVILVHLIREALRKYNDWKDADKMRKIAVQATLGTQSRSMQTREDILQAQNAELRDLLTRVVSAGVEWEFGGSLRDDITSTIERHSAER